MNIAVIMSSTIIMKSSNCQFSFIVLIKILIWTTISTNTSVCNTFRLEGVYYTVNKVYTNSDTILNNMIYNYCQKTQYYCQATHKVITASLIRQQIGNCIGYEQADVLLIDSTNISKGVKLIYRTNATDLPLNISNQVVIQFVCLTGSEPGCLSVEQSSIFSFFQKNQLGFTITLEVIGIIFMTLGLYIYRISNVLLGACTMLIILLAVQVQIIFSSGVPNELISQILILSGICSFFAGYVFGYFPKLGIFMLGSWIGLILSLTLNNIAFYFIKSNPANLTLWIVMPICCVLFGVLSLFIKKTFIIFATSLIGAYMCLRALSWYLGAFPNQFLLARKFHLGLSGPVPWQFYLYVIALVILTASSSALQYWLFTKKSESSSQPRDIDQEFESFEAKLNAERQNLAQIADFKEIFKVNKSKEPKVLKRKDEPSEASVDEDLSQFDPAQLENQQQSQQRPTTPPQKKSQKRTYGK